MSKIEWTGKTWNPVTGCDKVSAGCKHCYAEVMSRRLKAMGQQKYANGFTLTVHEDTLNDPYTWKKPTIVFVNSMSDLFHKEVPLDFIQRVFAVMNDTPQHTYQILTKRPERAFLLNGFFNWTHNIWLGTSVEDSRVAERIVYLKETDAKIKFLSCEPLLGPLYNLNLTNIDWVITGGESGFKSRPMHPDWARNLRDQCVAAGVPFFFKQWGNWKNYQTNPISEPIPLSMFSKKAHYYRDGQFKIIPGKEAVDTALKDFIFYNVGKKVSGRLLDGREWNEMPVTHNTAAV